jgi:hypothetical protein
MSLFGNHLLSRTVFLFFFAFLLLKATFTLSMGAVAGYSKDIDFDSFELDKVPVGFVPILIGTGKEISWVVKTEPSALSGTKVLAQTSIDDLDFRFPIVLYDELIAKDVDVTVQFKTLSGKVSQAAGIIFRFQDEDHFYVVRANALENEVRLYKVVDGALQSLAGETVKVSSNEWHTLRVAIEDIHFQVFFDDQALFETNDPTVKGAGKIGLSTKSDSVTIFDNLHIESRDT